MVVNKGYYGYKAAEEIGRKNKIILEKFGQVYELRKFAKIVVAEKIGRGNEIILSKIGKKVDQQHGYQKACNWVGGWI